MAADEVILPEWVLRLDGNVVELLHRTGLAYRYHVSHVAVEAERREQEMRLRVGVEVDGTIVGGARLEVPPGRQASVEALFERARMRREQAAEPPQG